MHDDANAVESCDVFLAERDRTPTANAVLVKNPGGDTTALELQWLEGACADEVVIELERRAETFSLVIRPVPRAGDFECPAIGYPYGAVLHLKSPIDAASVTARYDRPN